MPLSFKLEENRESNLIAKSAFRGNPRTSKIRELYRVICENTENKNRMWDEGEKREIEIERGLLGGSKKVGSADQIDQLGALRFKTPMGRKNL